MKEVKRIRNRTLGFLLLLLIFCSALAAQVTSSTFQLGNAGITQKKYDFRTSKTIISTLHTLAIQEKESKIKLPEVYNFQELALFCKLEESVARQFNLNMRFRLGSVEYVDQLEQKPYTQFNHLSKKQ